MLESGSHRFVNAGDRLDRRVHVNSDLPTGARLALPPSAPAPPGSIAQLRLDGAMAQFQNLTGDLIATALKCLIRTWTSPV